MNTKYAVVLLLAACCARAEQTISVTGDAEIKVVPDQVVISLGIEVHSETLGDARRGNDARVRSVRAAIRGMGIDEKDIQTDFIQLAVQYKADGITPAYYYARKSIVLMLHDANQMETVLAAAVDAGATHIHGVEFETSKLREYRDQARALAVKAATEKARDMTAAAGLKVVGGPVGISASQFGGRSWYGSGWGSGGGSRGGMPAQNVYYASAGGAETQGTIALGRISVTASVSMQFRTE